MKFMFFSIKYRYSNNNIIFFYNRLFFCSHTCYCVKVVSVTSASRNITSASLYHPHYPSRSSMYIRGLIPRNYAESAKAVPIGYHTCTSRIYFDNVTLTAQKPCQFNNKFDCSKHSTINIAMLLCSIQMGFNCAEHLYAECYSVIHTVTMKLLSCNAHCTIIACSYALMYYT